MVRHEMYIMLEQMLADQSVVWDWDSDWDWDWDWLGRQQEALTRSEETNRWVLHRSSRCHGGWLVGW